VVIAQGDIWLLESPDEKQRPVLIVSRDEVLGVLTNLVVAPLTTTIRPIPTCIPVGAEEGVDRESVASFDNLSTVPATMLTRRLGRLGPGSGHRICLALDAVAGC
jgi:mRNA interferase MazF